MNKVARLAGSGLGAGLRVLALLVAGVCAPARGAGDGGWLDASPFRTVGLEVDAASLESLRAAPRTYVTAMVRVDGLPPVRAGIRLRGSRGSFRPVDDRPCWTLDFEREGGPGDLGGVPRLQLGNGAEDPGLLHEWVGTRLAREAGIPAPRVVHARVSLNGRPLGLQVMKEGFSRSFLARHWGNGQGALFDNDLGADLDQPMHQCLVRGAGRGQARLDAVAAEARVEDGETRWHRLSTCVDLERFLTFLALEVVLGHRDGYGLARNNYRLYLPAAPGRLVFLPDGMDQLLGNASLRWDPVFSGTLARAVLETPPGRRGYEEAVRRLLDTVLVPDRIQSALRDHLARLSPHLTRGERARLRAGAADLGARVAARERSLRQQLSEPAVPSLVFREGRARVGGWTRQDDPGGDRLSEATAPGGVASLIIRGDSRSAAAWVSRFRVPAAGKYRVEGRCRAEGVVPRPGAREGGGGLRIGGLPRTTAGLAGDTGWVPVGTHFEVIDPTRIVDLRCELAAETGVLWAALDSLQVVREEGEVGSHE